MSAYIIGVSCTPFAKSPEKTFRDLTQQAYLGVLADAGLADGDLIENAWFSNCGMGTFGQRNIPALPAGVTYTHVDAGLFHTALVRSDGTVVTAGTNNSNGQLTIPALPAGIVYTQVDVGRENTVLMIDYAP